MEMKQVEMEKDHLRINEHGNFVNNPNGRDRTGIDGSLLMRGRSETTPSDFVLQWGNRKRLRCMKVQVKGKDVSSRPVHRTTVRVDRRVVRAEKESLNQNHQTGINNPNHHSNGYFNLRQRPISPQPPPAPPHRTLRNSEISSAMKGNGVRAAIASPERGGAHDKRSLSTYNNNINNNNNNNNNYHNSDNHHHHKSADAAHDNKKGGSSSGSGEAAAIPVWPPKFVIGLTNKEKEEDFMAIKGSKLPQRPKKRAKIIQRTINLVCPGTWLCDLTLERYEVREKKITKKRPRGLKAIVNMESDSE